MVLNLRASGAYICPEVSWRSPACGAGANGGCARKPMQAFVPILPQGGGYLSTKLGRGRAHLLSSAHRNTGVFDVALYGIDGLKEIGPQGQEWVEGSYIPEPGK